MRDRFALTLLLVASLGLLGLSWLSMGRPQSQIAGVQTAQTDTVGAILLPHHGVAETLVSDALEKLSSEATYDMIVVISPNHWAPEEGHFTTRKLEGYQLATEEIDHFIELTGRFEDSEEKMLAEHGVMTLLPYLAEAFPESKFLPISLSGVYRTKDMQLWVDYLSNQLEGTVLLVTSSDFAHNLMMEEAMQHDLESVAAIRSFNYEKIQSFDDYHMDARVGVELTMRVMEAKGKTDFEVWANSHSGLLLENPLMQGTSYVVGVFR